MVRKVIFLFLPCLVLSSCSTPRDLAQITITPKSQGLQSVGQTAQFTAIGQFTRSPLSQDITSQVTWSSNVASVATIDSAGLATAVNSGTTTIAATSTAGKNHAEVIGSATLTVGQPSLPTLMVALSGAGSGLVTSSPAGISCPTNCSAQFTLNTVVTLTAAPNAGASFGGWANCDTVSGNVCTVTLGAARTVNAAFN